jgi:hypothetical protein
MCGAIPPLLQYAFMVWCLVKKSTGVVKASVTCSIEEECEKDHDISLSLFHQSGYFDPLAYDQYL